MPLSRWFPTLSQLKDPASLLRTFKQTLTQQYALRDQHNELAAKVAKANDPPAKPSGPPPGSGPTDTQICGIHVTPIDTRTLPAGSMPAWNPTAGQITFAQGATFVTVPLHASSPGSPNQLAFDATHLYVCIATSTWIRASFAGGF